MENLRFLLAGVVLCGVLAPQKAAADDEELWWGAGGLLVGGAAGYLIGRDSARPAEPYYAYPRGTCASTPGTPVTSGVYYTETRVWPFYKRVVAYPMAASYATHGRPQAVSMASYRSVDSLDSSSEAEPREVNITIGDNNSDVQIHFADGEAVEAKGSGYETVAIVNRADLGKRVVNVSVPSAPAAPSETDATLAPLEPAEQPE